MPVSDTSVGGKIFTIEMAGSLAVSVFIMSGMWFGLTAKSDANTDAVHELKVVQAGIVKDVATIDKNVATLLARQEESSKAQAAASRRAREDLRNMKEFMQRMHSK